MQLLLDYQNNLQAYIALLWYLHLLVSPQFSSVLQNVQALREQTLMLVHGTADGKMAWVSCSKLTPSTKTQRSLGGRGPKVVNQEIREMGIGRGNNLVVKNSFKIWDLFPSSQIPIGSSFPGRIHNMLILFLFQQTSTFNILLSSSRTSWRLEQTTQCRCVSWQ